MKKFTRDIVSVFLLVALIIPNVKVDAASKYVSKKTITTTVNYNMKDGYSGKGVYIKAKKNVMIDISVEIVKMTGKAKYKPNTNEAKKKRVSLFNMEGDCGKGCMVRIPKNKFKKGAIIKFDDYEGDGYFELDKPYGVKSVTYRFTFTAKDNKKAIKSVAVNDLK